MSFCVQGVELLKKPKNQISFHRHFKFCSKPPAAFDEIGVSKARSAEKATTLKEYYNNESEEMRKLYE